MTIPEALDAELRRRRISERALATFLGVSANAVNAWHRGARKPDPLQCEILAERLGWDVLAVLRMAGHLRAEAQNISSMAEEEAPYHARIIDQRVVTLARTLTDRDLNVWIEMGEVLARTQDEP